MKKSNKGFSLVELIIVIAIMAILAAAIAPALIRYIDKSRRADDVQAGGTIATAVNGALANEEAYSEVNKAGASYIVGSMAPSTSTIVPSHANFDEEVLSSLGGVAPKFKYNKNSPSYWVIGVVNDKAVVYIQASGGSVEVAPEQEGSYKK